MRMNEKIMNYKFDGSRVFFTSDTHFNHTNIIRFCNRPFKDVSHMNETIIANWNRVVGPEDIVFHLGDFCLGGSAEWVNVLNRLNGKIYLISGNHDIKNLRQNYTKYFEQITMQMYIEVDKQKIYLNHCPFLCYGGSYDDTWQLFGHVHTRRNNTGKDASRLSMLLPTQYDVGVDNNDFTPVSFAQVKAIIGKQIEHSKKGEL
jgi:calcineurin-like phosphoesterase family protein